MQPAFEMNVPGAKLEVEVVLPIPLGWLSCRLRSVGILLRKPVRGTDDRKAAHQKTKWNVF
jgi:hypothetical protein